MSNVDPREEIRNAPNRDPAELQREADEARESIQRTLANLDRRLTPGDMFDRALGAWRRRAGDEAFTSNLVQTVRSNPMPVIVSSFGLAWLAASDRRHPRSAAVSSGGSGTSESAQRRASEAAQRASRTVSGARDSAREAIGSTRSRAARARGSMSGQGSRAREGFTRLQEEQPFLLGAVGVALGAILGGAVPASRTEQRVAGQYGSRVRQAAEETAESAREQAEGAAAAAGREAAGRAESSGSDESRSESERSEGEQSRSAAQGEQDRHRHESERARARAAETGRTRGSSGSSGSGRRRTGSS